MVLLHRFRSSEFAKFLLFDGKAVSVLCYIEDENLL